MMLSRRDFTSATLGIFALRDNTIKNLHSLVRGGADPEDEKFWMSLREQFEVTSEWIPFNHAGLSPSPKVVQDTVRLESKRANSDPSMVVYRQQANELTKIRERLAKLIGCAPENLALTPNATYGLHTGVLGVAGDSDRVNCHSAHEYPRGIAAMAQRKLREGVPTVEMPIPSDVSSPAELKKELLNGLPPKPLVGLFSTLTYANGTILPVKEICQEVRKRGGFSLIDGAQSIGIMPQDVVEMDCDMYTACLHKWIMGPVGTGLFYVKPGMISNVWALHPAEGNVNHQIQKFEHYGTRSYSTILALAEALDLHDMLGLEAKRSRIRFLRSHLRNGLSSIEGVEIYSAADPMLSDILLTFGVKKMSGPQLASELLTKYRIHTSPVSKSGINGTRLSPTLFTSIKECDDVISAVREITAKRE